MQLHHILFQVVGKCAFAFQNDGGKFDPAVRQLQQPLSQRRFRRVDVVTVAVDQLFPEFFNVVQIGRFLPFIRKYELDEVFMNPLEFVERFGAVGNRIQHIRLKFRFVNRSMDFVQDRVDGFQRTLRSGKIIGRHVAERRLFLRVFMTAGTSVIMMVMRVPVMMLRRTWRNGVLFQRVVGDQGPFGTVTAERDGLHHGVIKVNGGTRQAAQIVA